MPALFSRFDGRAILRAIHFFEENSRVDVASIAIREKDERTFLRMINESGDSSYKKLQNCYVPGEKEQMIPLALCLSRHFDGVKAARVHGGGFAGTILAFVQKEKAADYAAYMSVMYGKQSTHIINIRNNGTERVNLI